MRILMQLAVVGVFGATIAALYQRDPQVFLEPQIYVYIAILSILILAWIFGAPRGPRAPLGEIFINLGVWAGIIFGLAVVYDHRDTLQQAALKTLSSFRPGEPVMLSDREAVLTRERSGHFTAYATVNGKRVHMLVDTGSTDVALPLSDARRLGIDVDRLVFDRQVMTANGRALVAPVMLERVAVGGIELHNVAASVAQSDRLGGALLGMSYLGRLREFSFKGDKLILKE